MLCTKRVLQEIQRHKQHRHLDSQAAGSVSNSGLKLQPQPGISLEVNRSRFFARWSGSVEAPHLPTQRSHVCAPDRPCSRTRDVSSAAESWQILPCWSLDHTPAPELLAAILHMPMEAHNYKCPHRAPLRSSCIRLHCRLRPMAQLDPATSGNANFGRGMTRASSCECLHAAILFTRRVSRRGRSEQE
jgi:hypothetical protein